MVKRGEVWWADLGDNPGSEPSFDRPVLVIQSDAINRSTFNTVIVIGVTSNTRYGGIPGNVFIPRDEGIFPKDSVIVCANLAAIDRSRFKTKMADLPDLYLDQVEFGLSIALDLR